MNKQLEFLTKLKSKILQISTEINSEENLKINELEGILNDLLNKVNNVKKLIENNEKVPRELRLKLDDFENLDDEIIKKLFPNYNIDSLKEIKALNWKSPFFNRNKPEILNKVSHFCTTLLEEIKIIKQKTDILIKEKEKVAGLCDSFQNEYTHIFSNGNITMIVEMLRNEGKTEDEILDYLKEMFFEIEAIILNEEKSKLENLSFDNKNDKNPEDLSGEILEENEEDIETIRNKIIVILVENGYGDLAEYFEKKLNPRDEKAKNDLYTFGNVSNIEEIIKILKNYDINLLKEIENGNFFKIIKLLLYSSSKNVEKIFNLALEPEICICEYDEEGNLILDENNRPRINFTLLLETPSRFIDRRKRYKRRKGDYQDIEISSEVEGNLGDYISNIRFFQNVLGVDFKKIFAHSREKTSDDGKNKIYGYLDLPHEKILRNKNAFDLYEIPSRVLASALTCFRGSAPEDVIDMFIELDLFDYLLNNISNVYYKADDPIFYAIVRTYQLADKLPNPQNLKLHENAKQFLFSKMKSEDRTPYSLKKYISVIRRSEFEQIDFSNPETIHVGNKNSIGQPIKKIQLNTGVTKTNGDKITEKYKREEVLDESELYNFKRFDEIVKNSDNISVELINNNSSIIRWINASANISSGLKSNAFLVFGREPNEFRISRMKFLRIYNTLCRNGFKLENDRDCILYAMTYNSILTKEQFELMKNIIDKSILKYNHKTSAKVGGKK